MPYLKLFHGRKRPDEHLEDWGEPGPIFGPYPYFHTTYGARIQFDLGGGVLPIVGDLVYYDGMLYGDWSVFDGPPKGEDALRHVLFDSGKAEVPESLRPCECELPGYFHCGVPGVIAHLENGRLPPGAKVERCDACNRYPSDDAARQKLAELGLVREPQAQRYSVHCYATVRVKLTGIEAPSPQAAARLADALFDWDTHRHQAEFADEMTEFLVDVEGDADCLRSRRFGADFEPVET